MINMESFAPTFEASLRAVGTASTMAFAGFYLHRRGFVTSSGQKMLALLSQQVTIPAFLFAKIIYCPNDGSNPSMPDINHNVSNINGTSDFMDADFIFEDPYMATFQPIHNSETICLSVADRISDLWIILLWPFYVVLCGLITGHLAAKFSSTPGVQFGSCLAACAFGNSTGLAMTLLTVIHDQFETSTELGSIDASAFLSVYLLLYPVLQWGVGGWLLAPDENEHKGQREAIDDGPCRSRDIDESTRSQNLDHQIQSYQNDQPCVVSENNRLSRRSLHIPHLLNYVQDNSPAVVAGQEEFGVVPPIRIIFDEEDNEYRFLMKEDVNPSNNALMALIKELSFSNLRAEENESDGGSVSLLGKGLNLEDGSDEGPLILETVADTTTSFQASVNPNNETAPLNTSKNESQEKPYVEMKNNGIVNDDFHKLASKKDIDLILQSDVLPLTVTLFRVASKVFQPPVIASLAGLLIASFPHVRGLMVNVWSNTSKAAPLQWIYDGVSAVGQAAVPINMAILGINLSSTFQKKSPEKDSTKLLSLEHNSNSNEVENKMLSNKTMFAVVVGKMIVMPVIGVLSTWVLQHYFIDFPDEIDAACYLVMMIVFITPTANNVMVMVELSGSGTKEGMARLIGWQYAVSPVILSLVLSVVVSLASCHFHETDICMSVTESSLLHENDLLQ